MLLFPLFLNAQEAFISGDDTICDNAQGATIKVDFLGNPLFNFVYAINGVNQPPITNISFTPYLLNKKQSGIYTLTSFSDLNGVGTTSGSAMVTVNIAPTALIHLESDTLSIIYPVAYFNSQSIGNIISWDWNFGDNSTYDTIFDPSHIFPTDSNGIGIPAVYQSYLIVQDNNGCLDTTLKQVWVREEYWMYIPDSFTPDNNKLNDKFCIEFHAIREQTFLFKIYNAQGDLMYQTTDPNVLKCSKNGGWDGTHYKTQNELPSDTYIFEMYFQDFEGWKHKEFGNIILVR